MTSDQPREVAARWLWFFIGLGYLVLVARLLCFGTEDIGFLPMLCGVLAVAALSCGLALTWATLWAPPERSGPS